MPSIDPLKQWNDRRCNVKDCPHFKSIRNTEESQQGLCGFAESYFPVELNRECAFIPKPYTCGDCDRLGNDYACYTCRKKDSAYHNGNLCAGFIDIKEEQVKSAIIDWLFRGFDIDKKLLEISEEAKKEYHKFAFPTLT